MSYQFFRIPLDNPDPHAEELNRFLKQNRVATVEKSFVEAGAQSCWAFCVCVTELGQMAERAVDSAAALREIPGIG